MPMYIPVTRPLARTGLALSLLVSGTIISCPMPRALAGAYDASPPAFPGTIAPANGALFGDHGPIQERESYFGRKIDIDNKFYKWAEDFTVSRHMTTNLKNGRIPMVSWGRTYATEVSAGMHDDLIRARADGVKALGKPILIRLWWEPEVTRWSQYAGTPAQYIDAWRHIHDIFVARGATNAEWVWCPVAADFKTGEAMPWYPGGAYVDWVASDGYNWYPGKQVASDTWRTFSQIFSAFYSATSGLGKPLMVGEYGAQEDTPGRKAQWVTDARNTLKTQFPLIKAVVYFDSLGRFDWRMTTSASGYQAFKDMANDPYFNPRAGDSTAPTAPTNLVASAASETQVNLTWTASTDSAGVSGYDVYRDGSKIASSGTTAYSDTTVAPGTTYAYVVRARDAAGNTSAPSNQATATTPGTAPDTTAPSSPADLRATAASETQVDLTWTASTDDVAVVAYDIFRNGAKMASSGTTAYTDTTVAAGMTYQYVVQARDAAGNASGASNEAGVTMPGGTALFDDGFESGNLSAWTKSTGVAPQQTKVFSGAWAARAASTGPAAYARKTLASGETELYYLIRFHISSQGANPVTLQRLQSPTGKGVLRVYVTGGGKLAYRNEVKGVSVASSSLVSRGAWHGLQVHVLINGSASQVELWLDGAQIPALSKTLALGTGQLGRVQLGENLTGRTYSVAFDDVAVSRTLIP